MLALLPEDAPHAELAPLPQGVRLATLGDATLNDEHGVEAAEFAVLDPRQVGAFTAALPRLRRLRVVQTLNAGVEWVPPLPEGVLLCNAGGVHDGPVAEWVVAVVLAVLKRLPQHLDHQRAGVWDHTANLAFGTGPPAGDLAETTVLIIGYGSIGRALAARLRPFGTTVVGVARRPRAGVPGPDAIPELLPRADVVVLLAPATAETRGLVGADFLARMRQGAVLVNASRGSLVDTAALLDALHQHRVRAVLDTTDPEPLPSDHPMWSAPGVLVTPHVAGSSAHWRARAYRLAGEQLRRYAAGLPLRHVRRHGY